MRPERPRRGRRVPGFTLLEVLAAVAVLGLVYSVLATAAIQGLRAEGDAGRRLRASLLADQRITEIEAKVATGQTPEIGESEADEDEFVVRTTVKPLDLEIAETRTSKRARDRLDRTVGAGPKPTATAGSLVRPAGTSKQSMLRRIDLSVTWSEGASEQSVERTTYGLDMIAAAPLIQQLVAAAEAEKAEEAKKPGRKTRSKKGEQPLERGAAEAAAAQPPPPLRPAPPGATGGDR